MIIAAALSSLLLFQTPTVTPRQSETPQPGPSPQVEQRETPPVITKHSIRIGRRQLSYTTTAGFMPIKNAVSGETEARIFYMAYTLDDAPAGRPLMFSFNGGPGSASVWLHMGALGPKRVKMLDDGSMPPAPYSSEENELSWLDQTDLVFIDPVGTGYSRAAKPEFASKFFGLTGDIDSVGEFIRMYLGRNERWSSPLYLVGESYGTTRAAGLSNHLFERGIALNGIVLISTVMNFQSVSFADNNDLPLILIFPSYTATAWYHKQLAPDLQKKPLREVLSESESFAISEFGPAMLRIDKLNTVEKASLLDKFSRLSGLDRDFVDENNFRITLGEYNKELLRKQRRSTGRLDSRFLGYDKDSAGTSPDFDPSMTAIRTPYTAVFNDYVRRELGVRSDLEYYILGGGITSPWNWSANNQYADTSQALSAAMRKNPFMKVMVASGYYDMATPYFAAEYTVSAMNLDPQLRRNFLFTYYEAGHMMYIDKNSLRKLKEDVSGFIQNSSTR